MPALLIHPGLTLGESLEAAPALAFLQACREELEQYLEVTMLPNLTRLDMAHPSRDDALVFFNGPHGQEHPTLTALLRKAVMAETEIVPIAMTRALRLPPDAVSASQSWDVIDQLRQRSIQPDAEGASSPATSQAPSFDLESQLESRALPRESISTLAVALARTIVARLQPTLSRDKMAFFISHRRLDGELLAGALYDRLNQRRIEAFRDLSDVEVGQDAQAEIEASLSACDAVVFLDTPRVGESEWIEKELRLALRDNLPVVWVRFGPEAGRLPLRVSLGSQPHLSYPDIDLEAPGDLTSLVDPISSIAFQVARDSATRVFGHIRRLEQLAETHSIDLRRLDGKHLLYATSRERTGSRYPERPVSHLIQFFGRKPTAEDSEALSERLKVFQLEPPHPRGGAVFDAAVLLAPHRMPAALATEPGGYSIDSAQAYLDSLTPRKAQEEASVLSFGDTLTWTGQLAGASTARGIIMSGALLDAITPEQQRQLEAAVHAFAAAILERGAAVIIGSHPTFQPIIFDLAQERRPLDFKEALRVYISPHFARKRGDIAELEAAATLFTTGEVPGDRGASLTLMRQAMIDDPTAIALVAIGGRGVREGIVPGVDEEVQMAKARGLPVFYLGATGGQAAVRAAEEAAGGWQSGLNGLTPAQNEELRLSQDYDLLADLVLDSLGLVD